MKTLVIALTVLMPVMAVASEPGQPLDCSDWVFLEPGLGCVDPCPVNIYGEKACVRTDARTAFDNEGRLLLWSQDIIGTCGARVLYRHSVLWLRTASSPAFHTLAYLEDRCVQPDVVDTVASPSAVVFDAVGGQLYVAIDRDCQPRASCLANYFSHGIWTPILTGFTTLLEIFQSYESTAVPISFRVPQRPEGLAAADHFDTYYGPLSGPKDFSQAQPLRCSYPATIPQPGDYLEAGIVPDPPSRQGYYYVTAATYQGETRYGRKRENGVLSGRDPSGLPPCVEAAPQTAQRIAEPRANDVRR